MARTLRFSDLPGWRFEVEEVSAGVYVVRAFDRQGLRIELTGQDPDALLDQCQAETGQAVVEPDSRDSS